MSNAPDPRLVKLVQKLSDTEQALLTQTRRASQFESLWRREQAKTRTTDAAAVKKRAEKPEKR
jgi:hypothetical protein